MIEWLSVKEELPEPGSEVIVYSISRDSVDKGFYTAGKFRSANNILAPYYIEVTHWAPFNKPARICEYDLV